MISKFLLLAEILAKMRRGSFFLAHPVECEQTCTLLSARDLSVNTAPMPRKCAINLDKILSDGVHLILKLNLTTIKISRTFIKRLIKKTTQSSLSDIIIIVNKTMNRHLFVLLSQRLTSPL